MERQVSAKIRDLPFLWVDVDDKPSPESDRAYIERNAIALAENTTPHASFDSSDQPLNLQKF
ncbi:MAG: hypothetical protein ABEI86_05290 [Halobacteriaceae archaeon]